MDSLPADASPPIHLMKVSENPAHENSSPQGRMNPRELTPGLPSFARPSQNRSRGRSVHPIRARMRRHELAELIFGHLQQREGHWAIVDLSGKAGHVRTIPVPDWVHGLLNEWTQATKIDAGKLFRRVSSAGRAWGEAVLGSVGTPAANWSRFNSFLATSRSRPQNATSVAPSGFYRL